MWDFYKFIRLKRSCRAEKLPNYICDYINLYKKRPSLNCDWKDLRFIVLDTETTGLNPQRDKILSLGAVLVQKQEIWLEESLELILRIEEPQNQSSIIIHGITNTELEEGVDEKIALETFIKFIGNAILVAHHAKFDITIIEKRIQQFYPHFFIHNIILDTAHLAFLVEHPDLSLNYMNPRKFSLDALCKKYRIIARDRHTAWGDALITAKLFLKFLHHLHHQRAHSLRSLFP